MFQIISTLIDVTLGAAILFGGFYFAAALMAHLHDSLMGRFTTTPEVIAEPAPVEEPALTPEPIEVVTPTEPAPVAPKVAAPALPGKIRELRQYIRDNGLQSTIKERLNKSVSRATKGELLGVLAVIA